MISLNQGCSYKVIDSCHKTECSPVWDKNLDALKVTLQVTVSLQC